MIERVRAINLFHEDVLANRAPIRAAVFDGPMRRPPTLLRESALPELIVAEEAQLPGAPKAIAPRHVRRQVLCR